MRKVRPPRGVLKVLLGLPLLLTDLGLGRLLGNRFVVVTHLGRRSGRVYPRPRQQTLDPDDAARTLGAYVGRYRVAAGMLGRFLGWPPLDRPGSVEEITKVMPMVRFSANPSMSTDFGRPRYRGPA